MFATAHRVQSHDRQIGINAGVYDDVDGTQNRVAQRVDVPPGGNLVLDYLDLRAPGPVDVQLARSALREAETCAGQASNYTGTHHCVGIEFATTIGEFEAGNARTRFAALSAAVLRLLERLGEEPIALPEPLVITVDSDDEKRTFRLKSSSRRRMVPPSNRAALPSALGIRHEVEAEFVAVHGEIYPYAAELLTGLTWDELRDAGGVQICAPEGRVVWSWPPDETL